MMVSYAAEFIVNKVEIKERKNKKREDNKNHIFKKLIPLPLFVFVKKWWENF